VKKILSGFEVDKAVSTGALANPRSLEPFIELASAL
jgi:acetoacetyl-CoA synthetase